MTNIFSQLAEISEKVSENTANITGEKGYNLDDIFEELSDIKTNLS